jgi:hypothetical protein
MGGLGRRFVVVERSEAYQCTAEPSFSLTATVFYALLAVTNDLPPCADVPKRHCCGGSNSSIQLPAGSSSRICLPPFPMTISFRK